MNEVESLRAEEQTWPCTKLGLPGKSGLSSHFSDGRVGTAPPTSASALSDTNPMRQRGGLRSAECQSPSQGLEAPGY